MSCGLVLILIHAGYIRVILRFCLHVRFSSIKSKSKHSERIQRGSLLRLPGSIAYWRVLHLCLLEVVVVCLFFLVVGRIAPAFGQMDKTDCLHLCCCYPRFPDFS